MKSSLHITSLELRLLSATIHPLKSVRKHVKYRQHPKQKQNGKSKQLYNSTTLTGPGPNKTGKGKLIIIIILIVAIIAGGFYFFGESLGLKGSVRMKEKGSTEMKSIKSTKANPGIKIKSKTNTGSK